MFGGALRSATRLSDRVTDLAVERGIRLDSTRAETVTSIACREGSALQKLAYDFVDHICQNADRIPSEHAGRLSDQAVDLVAMALAEKLGTHPLPASMHRTALLYRIKAHIRARLSDPDLSLAETAAEFGITPRYITDLLSDEQTSFQRYVLGERLAQCRNDLASSRLAHRTISEIAFGWGFNDVSHFGRVFRERFGQTPRDWRHSALSR